MVPTTRLILHRKAGTRDLEIYTVFNAGKVEVGAGLSVMTKMARRISGRSFPLS
jgi:hypothetical protein